MYRDIQIYRAYIEAKSDPKKTAADVARRFKITRNALYSVISRIENGSPLKLRLCTEKSRLECLWKYKYLGRFAAIPTDRKPASVAALSKLIKEMKGDDFPVLRIAALIGKDRSTVLHHLEK